jgi:hypothetical protein
MCAHSRKNSLDSLAKQIRTRQPVVLHFSSNVATGVFRARTKFTAKKDVSYFGILQVYLQIFSIELWINPAIRL